MPPPPDDMRTVKLEKVSLRDINIWKFPLRSTIRVLVVVDTEIDIDESPGAFGVGRVIRLLRETVIGCTRFTVDVASRDKQLFSDQGAGGAGTIRYPGFRFDSVANGQLVIDRYHEILMFGFKPDNNGGADSRIDDPNLFGVVPMLANEEDSITNWMNAGGGIFATGDHDYLGATMCHHIPRVRSMRRWTNADGVPTIGGTTRIDTNQPFTAAEQAGTAVIGFNNQGDSKPQPIDWVPVVSYRLGLIRYKQPHEVLCHPTRGPIDVMPDHPHEGLCVPTAEIEADPVRRAEFPGAELPQVIAYGDITPDPPLQHAKGDVAPLHFPMISAYNGRMDGVGRVVVDSTWHHWMDLNIFDIEAAGGANWDKIARYFINVAKWIAPPGVYHARCWWEIIFAHFEPVALEEFHRDATVYELGTVLHKIISLRHGPCTVREWVFDWICEFHPALCSGLTERFRLPEPKGCLTCPPFELFEQVILGGMVEGTRDLAEKIRALVEENEPIELNVETIAEAANKGASQALEAFAKEVVASARSVEQIFG